MARINVAGCGHGNKMENYAGGITVHYNEFSSTMPDARARLDNVRRAFAIVDSLDKKMSLASACNAYFVGLPKAQSFRHFWRDNTIFINYDPTPGLNVYGDTHTNDKDISLHRWCIDSNNHWVVGATIIHEFAHIGGAPGQPSQAAELALPQCGFAPQFNPAIIGSIQSLARALERMS